MASAKAATIAAHRPKSWVLGADTVVSLDKEIIGKPEDAADALRILHRLQGRRHQVITGFCILDPSGSTVHTQAVSTDVRFKGLTEQEIESYIRTGEPFGKAGAYAIQGLGGAFVERIDGSYSGVVGLPVFETMALLRKAGIT